MPIFDFICEECGAEQRVWRRKDQPPRFCSKECKSKGMAGQSLKPVRYIITPEMHEKIKEIYKTYTGNGEINALAQELRLPRWKITRYAITNGWIARQKKEPEWTEKEVHVLEQAAHLSPDRIRMRLKHYGFLRSTTGIVLKRRRMRFLANLKGQSARSVAECFGVEVKVITRAINLGQLKAGRRGTDRIPQQGGDMWFIKDSDIRAYIMDYLTEIDIRKVDKYWFVDVILGARSPKLTLN